MMRGDPRKYLHPSRKPSFRAWRILECVLTCDAEGNAVTFRSYLGDRIGAPPGYLPFRAPSPGLPQPPETYWNLMNALDGLRGNATWTQLPGPQQDALARGRELTLALAAAEPDPAAAAQLRETARWIGTFAVACRREAERKAAGAARG